MDNMDFDKIFNDKLQEELEFDYRDSDWQEVEAQIQSDPGRRIAAWWKWLVLLMIVLFGGVIFWFNKSLKGANEEINFLNEKVKILEIKKVDTIDQTVTRILYDTIYEEVKIKKQGFRSQKNRNRQIGQAKKILNPLSRTTEVTEFESYAQPKQEEIIEPRIPFSLLEEVELKKEVPKFEEDEEKYYLVERQFPKKKKWYNDRLKVGISNSWGLTEYSGQDSSFNSIDFIERRRVTMDLVLKTEWTFGERIRAIAAIGLNQIQFHIKDGPLYNYYSNGDLVDYKVTQRSLQYQLGLKYVHQDYRKWTPYVGFVIDIQSFQKQMFEEYFIQQQEVERNKTVLKQNELRVNALSTFIGFEYHISNQFSWQIEPWYNLILRRKSDQLYANFGIRNAIIYNF